MKKILLALLCGILVLASVSAFAADNGADPLTFSELSAWADEIRQLAITTAPENDPHDPQALTEDGYACIYPFGTLYFNTPDVNDEAILQSFVIYDEDIPCLRGSRVDMWVDEIISLYYSENPDLDGDQSTAVLYLKDDMPTEAAWGWVIRDGQRVQMIQYSVCSQAATDGDNYINAGILYTVEDHSVSAIRVYGLALRGSKEDAASELDIVRTAASSTGYHAWKQSTQGLELDPFAPSDLVMSGMDLTSLSPDTLISACGMPAGDEEVDNTDGFLRVMTYDSFEIIFALDQDHANPHVMMVELFDDTVEGPRGVRLGDSLTSVIDRFHFGEGEANGQTQMLYGQSGIVPYGEFSFGDDASADLRYTALLDDGTPVMLSLHFEMLELVEILIFTL